MALTAGVGAVGWMYFQSAMERDSYTREIPPPRVDSAKASYLDLDYAKKLLIQEQQVLEVTSLVIDASSNAELKRLAMERQSTVENDIRFLKTFLAESNEPFSELSDFPQMEGHDAYPTLDGMAAPTALQALESISGPDFDLEAI